MRRALWLLSVSAMLASLAARPAHAQPAMFGEAVADVNSAPFSAWSVMQPATTYAYTAAQLRTLGYRSIEVALSSPGTVTLTDAAGDALALPLSIAGPYQLPFVPVRVDFSGGAVGTVWWLK